MNDLMTVMSNLMLRVDCDLPWWRIARSLFENRENRAILERGGMRSHMKMTCRQYANSLWVWSSPMRRLWIKDEQRPVNTRGILRLVFVFGLESNSPTIYAMQSWSDCRVLAWVQILAPVSLGSFLKQAHGKVSRPSGISHMWYHSTVRIC